MISVDQRVRVVPKRRERWELRVFAALFHKVATVTEIRRAGPPLHETVLVSFDEPVKLGGERAPISEYWVELDEVQPLEAAYDPRGTCPGCGDKALDGKATCGRAECGRVS